MELDPHTTDISAWKAGIVQHILQTGHFTDIVNNDAEVAANRGTTRLSILHLPIAGRSFYEQVMAAGDDFDTTRALVEEVVDNLT
jgi:hypothetical protein